MAFTLKVAGRIQLAPRVFELVFHKPEDFVFQPGQHLRFHHQGLNRDYTPVSLAKDETIRICVRQRAESGFSTTLTTCDIGTDFGVSGPHGHFIFHPPLAPGTQVVFIGTGTGIAPFVAFAKAGASGYNLLQGARTPADLIYKEEVSRGSCTYVPCISHPDPSQSDNYFHGRVTDYLTRNLPQGEYLFYLCGQRQMILDTMDLIDENFPGSRVFAERFS